MEHKLTHADAVLVYPAHLADSAGWSASTITTPIAPLEFDLRAKPFADGFARALGDLLGVPVDVGVRRASGLLETLVDIKEATDDATSVWCRVDDFRKQWLAHVRPATLRILDAIGELAYAPVVEQLASLGEVAAGVEEITYLHHTMLLPARAALAEFADFVISEALLDSPLDALCLVAGRGNPTTEAAQRLWRLRGMAMEQPVAHRLLVDTLETVAQEGEGYGLTEPGWLEDTAVPLAIATAYPGVPLIYGPAVRVRLADQRRATLEQQARSRLSRCDCALGEVYERQLARARSAVAVTEDHGPIMHARLAHELRRFALSLGKGLVQIGRLDDQADVVEHHIDELAGTARPAGPSIGGFDTATAIPNPNGSLAAAGRAQPAGLALPTYIHQVFGQRSPATAGELASSLQGEPAASGNATGRARKLRQHADLGGVQPGDILVTPDNSSIWTFGLPIASAIVAPGGSRYGHVASLARDYMRPAVVGLSAPDLDRIEDGDQLSVDGDNGLVVLEPRASS